MDRVIKVLAPDCGTVAAHLKDEYRGRCCSTMIHGQCSKSLRFRAAAFSSALRSQMPCSKPGEHVKGLSFAFRYQNRQQDQQ